MRDASGSGNANRGARAGADVASIAMGNNSLGMFITLTQKGLRQSASLEINGLKSRVQGRGAQARIVGYDVSG